MPWVRHDSAGELVLFVSPAGLRRGSSFTSQNKLPRLAVPRMACRQTTFAGEAAREFVERCWHRRAIEARRCPRPAGRPPRSPPGRTRIAGPDATALVVMDDRRHRHCARKRSASSSASSPAVESSPETASFDSMDPATARRMTCAVRRAPCAVAVRRARWRGDVHVMSTLVPSRQRAPAPRGDVRGRSDGVWACWPRGIVGPRWPDDAHTSPKSSRRSSPPRMLSAGMPCVARRGGRVSFVR